VTLPCVNGHPNNPLTANENEEKFRRCISHGCTDLPDGYANNLIVMVAQLEYLADITDLIGFTIVENRLFRTAK
jgi:hypothetical protein